MREEPALPVRTNSRSAAETRKIASNFAKSLEAGKTIGLRGDLGAGKTTFVQGMAAGLGIDPSYYVNSPTFTMVNEYTSKKSDRRLVHVDLYRIAKPVETETLALDEYEVGNNIVVIEWAEKLGIGKRLDYEVKFEITGPDEREIIIHKKEY